MNDDFYFDYNNLLLNEKIDFPRQNFFNQEIVGIGGDFNPYRLLYAYSKGIFPWPDDFIYWYLPNYRMILYPDDFIYKKSFRQIIRNKGFEIGVDTRFKDVMQNCADFRGKNRDNTWILPEMIEAYSYLHQLGLAHSIESYLNNELVGGLYGISLGGMFFGESMFSLVPNASKIALHFLVQQLKAWEFKAIDAQVFTNHLKSLGATEIPNFQFQNLLSNALQKSTVQGKWTDLVDLDLFKKMG